MLVHLAFNLVVKRFGFILFNFYTIFIILALNVVGKRFLLVLCAISGA